MSYHALVFCLFYFKEISRFKPRFRQVLSHHVFWAPTLSVVCVVHECFCSSDLGPWCKHSAAGVRPSECPSLRSAAGHVESALSGFLLGSLCPCKAGCVPPPVALFPLASTVFFESLHLITSEVLTTTYLVVQNEMVPPESPSLLFSPSLPLSGCLSVS